MRVAFGIALLACASISLAQGFSSPAKGSKDRTAILDALRRPVQKDLGTRVEFKIDLLRVKDGWAFMRGVPQQPGGKKIDYKKTRYRTDIDSGAFDDWICALLQKKNGKWIVRRYVIGATDVVYEPWPKEFGAPRIIFDMP